MTKNEVPNGWEIRVHVKKVSPMLLGFYGRFGWFARNRKKGISAFSQYICFSGKGPGMRKRPVKTTVGAFE